MKSDYRVWIRKHKIKLAVLGLLLVLWLLLKSARKGVYKVILVVPKVVENSALLLEMRLYL